MADFLTAYKITAQNEGGFVNDPVDPGGFTYCGISRKNFPKWNGWPIVEAHLPLSHGAIINDDTLNNLVIQFYKENFWNPIADKVEGNQPLANQVYDAAVNFGVGEALKLLNQS